MYVWSNFNASLKTLTDKAMIEVALDVAHPTASVNEAEPLKFAMDMEQAREDLLLLLLLLAEDEASTLLLKQCRSDLNNGLDISEIVSDKAVNAIIVQAPDFVQLDLNQTVQYLLDNSVTQSALFTEFFNRGIGFVHVHDSASTHV